MTWIKSISFGLCVITLASAGLAQEPKVPAKIRSALDRRIRSWLSARVKTIPRDPKCNGMGYNSIERRVAPRVIRKRKVTHKKCYGTGFAVKSRYKKLDQLFEAYLPKAKGYPGLEVRKRLTPEDIRSALKRCANTKNPPERARAWFTKSLGRTIKRGKVKRKGITFHEPAEGFYVAAVALDIAPYHCRWVYWEKTWYLVSSADEKRLLKAFHEREREPRDSG